MNAQFKTNHGAYGFTLIEVLIAVLVLATGLLGFAALQTTSIKHNQTAAQRAQASQFAYDIADRIRSNINGAINGTYLVAWPKPAYNCATSFAGTTVANKCSTTEMANADLNWWYSQLSAALASGGGAITCTDIDTTDTDACTRGSQFTVQVNWQEADDSGFITRNFQMELQP